MKGVESKDEMRSLEVRALAQELSSLVGARLDKVYQPHAREFFLQLSQKGEGKRLVRILIPHAVYEVSKKPKMPRKIYDICASMRKHLGNSFLEKVEQVRFDRILRFTFGLGEKSHSIVAELFGKGNIVLLDGDDKILHALTYKEWRARSIKRGEVYEPPPSRGNPFSLKKEEFAEKLSEDEEIVRQLAANLGLGDAYAEEVCILAKVDKTTREPSEKELDALWKALQDILKKKPDPQAVWHAPEEGEKEMVDVVLFPLDFYSSLEQEPLDSISAGFERVFADVEPWDEEVSAQDRRQKKLDRILEQQQEMIESLKEGIVENQQKAERIYEAYPQIEALLKEIRSALEEKDWEQVREEFESRKGILQIDPKKKTVTIEIPDF